MKCALIYLDISFHSQSDYFRNRHKKISEKGFLATGLNIGLSSMDLTLSNSLCWPEPDKDKITLGEEVTHKQDQTYEFVFLRRIILYWLELLNPSMFQKICWR